MRTCRNNLFSQKEASHAFVHALQTHICNQIRVCVKRKKRLREAIYIAFPHCPSHGYHPSLKIIATLIRWQALIDIFLLHDVTYERQLSRAALAIAFYYYVNCLLAKRLVDRLTLGPVRNAHRFLTPHWYSLKRDPRRLVSQDQT